MCKKSKSVTLFCSAVDCFASVLETAVMDCFIFYAVGT
jgi:hypothetical protein